MMIQGHEIPDEFVRVVEGLVIGRGQDSHFKHSWILNSLQFGSILERTRTAMGLTREQWPNVLHQAVSEVFAGLRKAGKVEYLGRNLGWMVRR